METNVFLIDWLTFTTSPSVLNKILKLPELIHQLQELGAERTELLIQPFVIAPEIFDFLGSFQELHKVFIGNDYLDIRQLIHLRNLPLRGNTDSCGHIQILTANQIQDFDLLRKLTVKCSGEQHPMIQGTPVDIRLPPVSTAATPFQIDSPQLHLQGWFLILVWVFV